MRCAALGTSPRPRQTQTQLATHSGSRSYTASSMGGGCDVIAHHSATGDACSRWLEGYKRERLAVPNTLTGTGTSPMRSGATLP